MNEIAAWAVDFKANLDAIWSLGGAIRDHRADDARREWQAAPEAVREAMWIAMTWPDRVWLAWALR